MIATSLDRSSTFQARMRIVRIVGSLFALTLGSSVFLGCGGANRTTIDGLDPSTLPGKRIFVLLPSADGISISSPGDFAWSRGIAELNAANRFESELRTEFVTMLDARTDSNTILDYGAQPVGLTMPMKPDDDFSGDVGSWNWTRIEEASRNGGIDYLVIVSGVAVSNDPPETEEARGDERVSARVRLLAPATRQLLDDRIVEIEVEDPRVPRDTHVALARAVSGALPFENRDRR